MKSIFRFSIVTIAIIVLTISACHRHHVDYIGPAYVSAPEGFAVPSFTASPSPVDFTLSAVVFNATFTNAVSWTLTITGQTSGAVHIIKGTSNGLDSIEWTGRQDDVAFFRAGETATATLSFFGTSLTSSTTIAISKAPNFTTCGYFAPDGDFEILANITGQYSSWHAFNNPPIPNEAQGVGTAEVDYKGNTVPAIQGTHYYYIRGLGNQANYVSGLQYDPGLPAGQHLTPTLPADPDRVWVNWYIYGTGDDNTQVEIEYQEDDASDTKSKGVYKGTDDDAYVTHIIVSHKGWKLCSFQYSKLFPSLNADFGGSGNHIPEPNRLRSFDIVLVKRVNPNSPVETYLDYPIITVDGPFKPCK